MDADVIVAGAGPAGSATALALARRGCSVLIVDRSEFPRRKVCGEYLGAGSIDALSECGLGEAVRAHASPLHRIRLIAAGTRLEMSFPQAALALTRERLDATILAAARAAGSDFLRARVEDVVCDGTGRAGGVVVRDESGARRQIRGRIVVGADGVGSIVARKLRLSRAASRGAFAIGGHFRGVADSPGCIEMFVDAHAYVAINPLGDGVANVMAVVRRPAVEVWTRALDLAAETRVGPRVATGPLSHRVRTAAVPGAVLVGDASGFLNPFTGQGVMLALRGARRAAVAIEEALHAPERESRVFAEYAREIRREFGARARLARLVDLLVGVPALARRAAARLERSPELSAILLAALMGSSQPQTAMNPAILRRLLA